MPLSTAWKKPLPPPINELAMAIKLDFLSALSSNDIPAVPWVDFQADLVKPSKVLSWEELKRESP
ncbi:hypothetical protein PtA15_4A606 [Puccinia triticina]|uniref:Uncharacterized protein n=1 Tax=Puccinia triticina TaxID=208348 RepID=A0ABY7CK15_9BASI|nr:uncharacterized protein PtA15_4A606 [Puccinia triticina]WAQ84155.1 hypothetical protein PtA15_4A606 [Puccinia triticina]WAR54987.1 hypothetical protein PtB15_4B605 [Puccinia triticina]